MLTDIVMPGMNGFELAERLVTAHPEARVLYVSGAVDVDRSPRRLRDSAVLRQPFTRSELDRTLSAALP